MSEIYTLTSAVSYWDVDREQRMTLGGIFKLLQEAAIKHADLYGSGAKAMETKGESWVLNRLVATISRYPHYEEPVKVVTWSSGIRGFRGYRDLRLYCGDELVLSASSLWLYISLRTKTLVRVPEAIAAQFPVGQGEVFRADLDRLRFEPPADDSPATDISLRYSDFDGNGHLNNTAYFDCLQTALGQQGRPVRPHDIEIQFLKEVPPTIGAVHVALAPRDGKLAFGLSSAGELHAQGVAAV